MWLTQLAGSVATVIDRADAKLHLRLLENDNDTEVDGAIAAAHAYLDVDQDGFGGLGFPLISQSWSMKCADFGGNSLSLPFTRVTAIDAIDYIDADGAAGTIPPGNYMLTKKGRTPCVALLPGKSWPSVAARPDAVDIQFTAGFANAAAVPSDIKAAARFLVGHFFENRRAVIEGVSCEIQIGVDRLTARYRRFAA